MLFILKYTPKIPQVEYVFNYFVGLEQSIAKLKV